MVKDLSNQRLPRFQAGQPLLEQVTAERLNDICAMVEAARVQNGVGYTMNRSSSGTTLSILDSTITKNSKVWRVSFGEEFSKMEESMLAVYIAKDDEVLPDMYFPDPSIIRGNIEDFFTNRKVFPKNGDILCNETDGFRYVVFTSKTLRDCGGAFANSFYSIYFNLTSNSGETKEYFALYLGEHPKEPEGREPSQPIPGPAGANGKDGKDGKYGEDGQDGRTEKKATRANKVLRGTRAIKAILAIT